MQRTLTSRCQCQDPALVALLMINSAVTLRGRSVDGLPLLVGAAGYSPIMTFANVGTLGAVPGKRDELVAHLTAPNSTLHSVGCLAYEVGVSDDEPDTVFVIELWESAQAHQSSLVLPEVQAAIAAARPLLSGTFGGFRFDVAGSPLRG